MTNETPHDQKRVSRPAFAEARLRLRAGRSAKSLPSKDGGHRYFARGADVLRAALISMPSTPGVYRMIGEKGEVLYVGKAKALKKRVASYTQMARLPVRLQRMVALVHAVEMTHTHTEAEALLLEANLIRYHEPPFNVLLLDDKSYPSILITRHDFPQVVKYRGSREERGWYYGPFASAEAVMETLNLLTRGFQLRNCSDTVFAARKRPCLQYHIRRCTAPCVGLVTREEYAEQVKEACAFLSGKSDALLKELQAKMQGASEARDFESAAEIRDRIKAIAHMHTKQAAHVAGVADADVAALHRAGSHSCIEVFFIRAGSNYGSRAFFPQHAAEVSEAEMMSQFVAQFYAEKIPPSCILLSHPPQDAALLVEALGKQAGRKVQIFVPRQGEKFRLIGMALKNAKESLARRLAERQSQTALLEGMAKIFALANAPKRIEVYDNSHVSGKHAVGAMIVAGPEGFHKKSYRIFNIKSEDLAPGDDVAMLREVLKRRFSRALSEDQRDEPGLWPDVLLIDGGAGQLTAACTVLADLGVNDVPLIAIAKGPDRNAGRERFFMEGRQTFSLEPRDPVLYFLQRLRDEAHRFAIGRHRARRARAIRTSKLDGVPGVGSKRKRQLLLQFGSAEGVARAGMADLKRTPGISAELARKIYDYFHGGS